MKNFIVLLVLLLVVFVGQVEAQQKQKFATGRVASPILAKLKAISFQQHHFKLTHLPRTTAATFDCIGLGWVPPVRDQGQCGSCWDFSGTGTAACAYVKAGWGKNDGTFYFSEQYTLDCGQNGGCNGDDNVNVLDWAKKTGLPVDDGNIIAGKTTKGYGPYKASSGSCQASGLTLFKLQDWGFCDGSGNGVTDTQKIKDAMVAYGPIGAAIAADDAFMNNPPGTVFKGNNTDINHDIILVGWDDSKSAWKLRNSWGSSWCDNGYCWIAYGANSVGTEAVWAQAPPGPNLPPAITITSVSPSTGQAGTVVTVTGSGFTGTTSVKFGSNSATFTVASDTTITATAPTPTPTVSPTVDIVVATPGGTSTPSLADQFVYVVGPVPPTPGTQTITISSDMPAGTYQVVPSGSVIIHGDMTLREFADAIDRCKAIKDTTNRGLWRPVQWLDYYISNKVYPSPTDGPHFYDKRSAQEECDRRNSKPCCGDTKPMVKTWVDANDPATKPMPTQPKSDPRINKLETEVQELRRGVDAILKAILPPKKTSQRTGYADEILMGM